jgi:hypothetical protein
MGFKAKHIQPLNIFKQLGNELHGIYVYDISYDADRSIFELQE